MPEVRDDGLMVDPSEEAYLRRAFRRFAWPYVLGVATLVIGLWLLSERGDAPREAGPVLARDAAAVAELRSELDALRTELERVASAARAPAVGRFALEEDPAWGALLARLDRVGKRVTNLESRPSTRIESSVSQASPGLGDDVARGLLERMYNIETRQEQQETGFRDVQKSLLDRVYAIEVSRDQAVEERTRLEQALLGRMQNVEDRFSSLERVQSGSSPAAASE